MRYPARYYSQLHDDIETTCSQAKRIATFPLADFPNARVPTVGRCLHFAYNLCKYSFHILFTRIPRRCHFPAAAFRACPPTNSLSAISILTSYRRRSSSDSASVTFQSIEQTSNPQVQADVVNRTYSGLRRKTNSAELELAPDWRIDET